MTRHRSRPRSPRAHPTSSFIRKVSLSLSLPFSFSRCGTKLGREGVIFFLGKEEEGGAGGSSLQKVNLFIFFSPFNIRAVPRHCSLSRGVAHLLSTIVLSVPRSSEIIPTPPIVNRQ